MTDVDTLTIAEFLLARIAEDVEELGALRWRSAPIDRFDSARVLAECEAKRKIVERCQLAYRLYLDGFEYEILADDVLDQLAMPYADHPDYRDEWKP